MASHPPWVEGNDRREGSSGVGAFTRRVGHGEEGLSLIELLIVMVILPIVIGAAVTAMITSFRSSSSVQSRLSQSHDAQITSAYFVRDVQTATGIRTTAPTPICGTGVATQVLGLEWTSLTGPPTTVGVSYVITSVGASPPVLQRRYCADVDSPTTFSTSTLSHDLGTGSAAVTLMCNRFFDPDSECVTNAKAGVVSALDISSVELDVSDLLTSVPGPGFVTTGSPFLYTLTAVPRLAQSSSSSMVGSLPPLALLGPDGASCSAGNSSLTVYTAAADSSGAPLVYGTVAVNSGVAGALQVGGKLERDRGLFPESQHQW